VAKYVFELSGKTRRGVDIDVSDLHKIAYGLAVMLVILDPRLSDVQWEPPFELVVGPELVRIYADDNGEPRD
jgi:hypothetical protein